MEVCAQVGNIPSVCKWTCARETTTTTTTTTIAAAYLLVLEVHSGILDGGVHAAKPSGLRRSRNTLCGSLAGRVHQLPIGVCGIVGRKTSRQVLTDAHLGAFRTKKRAGGVLYGRCDGTTD